MNEKSQCIHEVLKFSSSLDIGLETALHSSYTDNVMLISSFSLI
jgi:hypothetical protein